jgi:catechol 2,3-dioxygenase-like lactoylglutathione lyase family enzyme
MQQDLIKLKCFSHAAIGAKDLNRQKDFYVDKLHMKIVEETSQRVFLRAAEKHHHALELIQDHKGLHHMAFEVEDDNEIDRASFILEKRGIKILQQEDTEPGIQQLIRFKDPEGNVIELVSNVAEHDVDCVGASLMPLALDHVTLFTGSVKKQEAFYNKVLGMRVRDRVPNFLSFLTCTSNHHSLGLIALPKRGFQHIAFNYANRSDMMNAMVELNDAGFKRIEGPGRHGPGNSLFSYFEDPEKNLVELIAEAELIDDPLHQPGIWKQKQAIDLWDIGKPMGPPPGLGWVVPLLPYISRLVKR